MGIPDGQYIPMCIYVRIDSKDQVGSSKFKVRSFGGDALHLKLQTSNF